MPCTFNPNKHLNYRRVVSLCMSPINDSFMSGSLDHSVRIWDLRVNACQVSSCLKFFLKCGSYHTSFIKTWNINYVNVIYTHCFSLQGILRLRGRPTVAYDQQGLVFAVAMEGGAIKLFDSRSYDKVSIIEPWISFMCDNF